MSSAAAGSNGKQSSTGLLSAMASLNPFGKSKGGGKSSSGNRGGGRGTNETVPRSYGLNAGGGGGGGGAMNRATSERTVGERAMQGGGLLPARRNSESAVLQPELAQAAAIAAAGSRGAPSHGGVSGNGAGGLKQAVKDPDTPAMMCEGKEMDIELGFPAMHIIKYWKEKEDKKFDKRMKDLREPPTEYAPHRRYMVDWISEVGEQLELQTVTIHSAVSFLDELMLIINYNTRDWHLYAVCCLSIAAKYEEAECNMPMISELADATEMALTTQIVTRGELELVQNKLQWDVSRVTAMHFLGYYTSRGVTLPDDTCQGRRLVDKVVTYMKKYVDFFANLCQQDYQFQRYKPSHIAAAAVLAARRALCISPVWRPELTVLTGYKMEDIVECGEELWNFYEKMFPTHKPLRTDTSAALKKAAEQAAASNAAAGAAPSSGSDARVMGANSRIGLDGAT